MCHLLREYDFMERTATVGFVKIWMPIESEHKRKGSILSSSLSPHCFTPLYFCLYSSYPFSFLPFSIQNKFPAAPLSSYTNPSNYNIVIWLELMFQTFILSIFLNLTLLISYFLPTLHNNTIHMSFYNQIILWVIN